MAKDEFMEEFTRAKEIAKQLFGKAWDNHAVQEIYDYLQGTDDEEEWANDLKDTIEKARGIYETDTPTSQQVFGMFVRRYGSSEE